MIKQSITPQDAVDLLNEALALDREAVRSLINQRVECNRDLGEHSTIQTGRYDNRYNVGLLGIINGLFGVDENEYGAIAAHLDEYEIVRFSLFKEVS